VFILLDQQTPELGWRPKPGDLVQLDNGRVAVVLADGKHAVYLIGVNGEFVEARGPGGHRGTSTMAMAVRHGARLAGPVAYKTVPV
jgi:hypothetical protein